MGTSTRPVLFTFPDQGEDLVSLCCPRCRSRNTSLRPVEMITGTLAQVSTLFRLVGRSQRPLSDGVNMFGPGFSHLSLDGGHQGRRFPADKGPASPADLNVEVENPTRECVFPRSPFSSACLNGNPDFGPPADIHSGRRYTLHGLRWHRRR